MPKFALMSFGADALNLIGSFGASPPTQEYLIASLVPASFDNATSTTAAADAAGALTVA